MNTMSPNRMLALFLSLLFFSPNQALAYPIPIDTDVLVSFGKTDNQILDKTIRIAVWNIHKGVDAGWQKDLANLCKAADLFFIQEVFLNSEMKKSMEDCEMEWNLATSFFKDDTRTGVALGSRSVAGRVRWFRTKYVEPVVLTPKMSIVSEIPVALGSSLAPQTLLIVNLHAINMNLRTVKSLREQLYQFSQDIERHVGPVIVAGDFNTWMNKRFEVVLDFALQHGLQFVSFEKDSRSRPLDHILAKGLKVKNSMVHSEVKSSDHKPLTAEFEIEVAKPMQGFAVR